MGGAMKDLDTSVKESLTAQSSDHIADAGKMVAEPVQEPVAAMKKPNVAVITADVRAALCFALWHHQGGSSSIGQPIREMLGLGQHDHMTSEQYFAAKRVAEALHAAPVSAKREWVDLTDDEIYDALAEVRFVRDNLLDGCRALIAAFKEKNK